MERDCVCARVDSRVLYVNSAAVEITAIVTGLVREEFVFAMRDSLVIPVK